MDILSSMALSNICKHQGSIALKHFFMCVLLRDIIHFVIISRKILLDVSKFIQKYSNRLLDYNDRQVGKRPQNCHYNNVMMSVMASQITGISIVCLIIYSADLRKHQNFASLTFNCEGNPSMTGGFPSKRASNAENISMWWRYECGDLHIIMIKFNS